MAEDIPSQNVDTEHRSTFGHRFLSKLPFLRELGKKKEQESSRIELSTFCRQLKLLSSDGKSYLTDCANTKGVFRIIQSIPSQDAEPFKFWLAKVGYERVQEIEDQEVAQMKEIIGSKNMDDK